MKQGINTSRAIPADSGEDRYCEECHERLEGSRAENRRAKYCADCSEIVKRRQSADWKREVRASVGWQEYQDMYNPYPTAEDKRAYHREYQQRWRQRNKSAS